MEILEFKLEAWTLNQTYNKIKNCRKVKPPYESDGYYSNSFYLDKRLDLETFFTWTGKKFLDMVTIKWYDYYLYREWNKHYIWTFNWNTFTPVTSNWFDVDWDSPIKFALWKWIYWAVTWTERTTLEATVWQWWEIDWELIPWYAWWYVKFAYTWTQNIQMWDYIVFSWDWETLCWWINRVEYVDNNWNIYIIWTNARWTVPQTWSKFFLYKSKMNSWTAEIWTTLLVWHKTGVSLCILNWHSEALVINPLKTINESIIDIVNFDWNVFALTENNMYFSRSTFNDNTQFYPLDYYYIDWAYKLFPIGKALLVFARTNKLFAAANSTWWVQVWYVWYDVNYNWNLYSKYSFIFDDQTIYILQKDKQLKQIDIVQNNSTTFDLIVKDVLSQTRWLFNELDWWEVFINSSQRFLNFLYVKDWVTVNYQYDKMYQDFMENEYNVPIYYFWDKILSDWKIYIENWINDTYQQEVNFMIDTNMFMYLPYIIRTNFWLVDNPFDVNLEISFEIWWIKDIIQKRLNWFVFDTRLTNTLTWDELLEDEAPEEVNYYNWKTVSIQSNILKTGRFINFKYYWNKRFMIGNSYVVADKTKLFINEPLLTN